MLGSRATVSARAAPRAAFQLHAARSFNRACGIVGMPNVGKSTLFNALTRTQRAEAANYPFCTIKPNSAVVSVRDPRLRQLAAIAGSEKVRLRPRAAPAPCALTAGRLRSSRRSWSSWTSVRARAGQAVRACSECVLTGRARAAGLVRGASTGAGLGNQFLAAVRAVAVCIHAVRCFTDPDVIHVESSVDPMRDLDIIRTELILADLQSLERKKAAVSPQQRQQQLAPTGPRHPAGPRARRSCSAAARQRTRAPRRSSRSWTWCCRRSRAGARRRRWRCGRSCRPRCTSCSC